MVQSRTVLNVTDNSGASKVRCIKILGTSRQYGKAGDLLLVSLIELKKGKARKKLVRGELRKAVLVRTKTQIPTKEGSLINFGDNAVFLIQEGHLITSLGSRIFGPVSKEIYKTIYAPILENLEGSVI